MVRIISILLLSIAIFGCNRRIVNESSVERSDSSSVSSSKVTDVTKTEIKDTSKTMALPVEKSTGEKLVNQDKGVFNSDTSKLETSTAISWAWVYDGVLQHWIKNKPTINVNVPITKISHEHSESDSTDKKASNAKESTKVVTIVKGLALWHKFFISSGVIAWILTLIILFKPKTIKRG